MPVSNPVTLPLVYPILDSGSFSRQQDPDGALLRAAAELLDAGATLIQYRHKSPDTRRFLSNARELRRLSWNRATLIINDRVDLCLAADADGVHLGQDDLSPAGALRLLEKAQTATPGRRIWTGFSTHNLQQVRAADALPLDYLAFGPVFSTSSKDRPDPVVGLNGLRQVREATRKPLVAIGGISRRNCREVKDSGADSLAVISDLLESPAKAFAEFMRILG